MTLKEKQTLTNPYYLFKLTHNESKAVILFNAQDMSSYPYRYNSFQITETSGTNNLNTAEVTIPVGKYSVNIYEQTSATNRDVSLTTSLLQQTIFNVTQANTASTVYSNNKTYTVYER